MFCVLFVARVRVSEREMVLDTFTKLILSQKKGNFGGGMGDCTDSKTPQKFLI